MICVVCTLPPTGARDLISRLLVKDQARRMKLVDVPKVINNEYSLYYSLVPIPITPKLAY